MSLIATSGAQTPQKVHISVMSGKLKGISAINTNTVTNTFCQKMQKGNNICKHCYSQAMLTGSRKNCQDSFQRNSDLLSSRALLPDEIPIINAAWFRFHGHGEIINLQHFHNLCTIVIANPQTTFALWTKRKDIVNEYIDHVSPIPDNLILIYSNPRLDSVMVKPPANFDKVFNNITDKSGDANCTGQKCMECLECYKFEGADVIVEHVKVRS
jgi:hypothetical protein